MAEVVRRRLRVSGHVQGVFFRATTRDVAERHGVTGWARNEPDGTVTVEVQGTPAAVDAVVDVVRQGPPRARVREVTVEPIPPVEGERGFAIR